MKQQRGLLLFCLCLTFGFLLNHLQYNCLHIYLDQWFSVLAAIWNHPGNFLKPQSPGCTPDRLYKGLGTGEGRIQALVILFKLPRCGESETRVGNQSSDCSSLNTAETQGQWLSNVRGLEDPHCPRELTETGVARPHPRGPEQVCSGA